MTLIKTSVLSAIATVISMINSFVVTKIIAIYVGPSGMALIGQFQNFLTILMSFATGAINNGVVKYTAEYRDNDSEKQKLWSTALRISLSATFLTALLVGYFHKQLSVIFFKSSEYQDIFLIFSLTLVFFVLNTLLLAILNGQKEIKKLTVVNIASSFISLLLTGSLAYYYGLYGALLSYSTAQALVFFITLGFVIKSQWFKIKFFTEKLNRAYLKKLANYTLMIMTTALTVPVSQIIVRDYIGETIDWNHAGYWDAISKISNSYLSIITTTLATYYLPKLSEINDPVELKKEILYGYKIVIPIVLVTAISIFYAKDIVIKILFTPQFIPMRDLFFYQLLGDIFKIASWLLGYIMVAKAMTKVFISTEIIFSLSFVLLSIGFIKTYGLIGVTMAFAINYFLYLIVMAFIFKNILTLKTKIKTI
ncbi:MAG: O-antigen translocase [Methylococcaceae bacterium]